MVLGRGLADLALKDEEREEAVGNDSTCLG